MPHSTTRSTFAERPLSLVAPERREVLRSIAAGAPPGAFVEVGVYKGGTAWDLYEIAQAQARPLYLYDTFTGTPHAIYGLDGNPVGTFADTSVADVKALFPEAYVIAGVFPDSLIPMKPIAFVHADGDQYETTRAICQVLAPRIIPGGMILFDDYGMGGCDGCTKAVEEELCIFTRLPDGRALWKRD